jgi:deoxyribodipyrimidine photolyase-related protein
VRAALVLGTQLLARHPAVEDPRTDVVLVVESAALFERLPYHQIKIAFLLSAMRHHVRDLEARGVAVRTVALDEGLGFAEGVATLVRRHGVTELTWMRAADRGTDDRLARLCGRLGIAADPVPDASFLTPEAVVDAWYAEHPQSRMEDFYRWQRQRLDILMDGDTPVGGQWNFDHDNREPLPRGGIEVPALPAPRHDDLTRATIDEVRARFADHPGDARDLWLPVTRRSALRWLQRFVEERLPQFGRYEDAMHRDEPVLFHSVLTPMLNVGLLTPAEVVDAALERGDEVPLASLEGFVRQIVGWREHMRGMYRGHPELEHANALELTRELEDWWYTLEGVPLTLPEPVRVVLQRVHALAYAHHIERLMVLGSWMLMQGYAPASVNRWFLSLFVDAYEWVMVPNVMGMSQFADGGLVGTKPYVSGGAYLQRMGRWWSSDRAARDSAMTDAYWAFLERHEPVLRHNHRLSRPLAQMRQRRAEREG